MLWLYFLFYPVFEYSVDSILNRFLKIIASADHILGMVSGKHGAFGPMYSLDVVVSICFGNVCSYHSYCIFWSTIEYFLLYYLVCCNFCGVFPYILGDLE